MQQHRHRRARIHLEKLPTDVLITAGLNQINSNTVVTHIVFRQTDPDFFRAEGKWIVIKGPFVRIRQADLRLEARLHDLSLAQRTLSQKKRDTKQC